MSYRDIICNKGGQCAHWLSKAGQIMSHGTCT